MRLEVRSFRLGVLSLALVATETVDYRRPFSKISGAGRHLKPKTWNLKLVTVLMRYRGEFFIDRTEPAR
jgi:hypothetical protein